jgi:dipeptidyl aminopeptidase/acylaminoacyl peptidase
VKTPTLILHGEKDTCVPVSQGMEWFRALREHGVEAHLRIYPRAGHGPNERPHIRDVQQRSVAWLVKHLKG